MKATPFFCLAILAAIAGCAEQPVQPATPDQIRIPAGYVVAWECPGQETQPAAADGLVMVPQRPNCEGAILAVRLASAPTTKPAPTAAAPSGTAAVAPPPAPPPAPAAKPAFAGPALGLEPATPAPK